MITLASVLDLLDESALLGMLGLATAKLVSALEGKPVTTEGLRSILSSIYSEQEILLDKRLRSQVFLVLRPEEALSLCQHLDLSLNTNSEAWDILTGTSFRKNSKRHAQSLKDISV